MWTDKKTVDRDSSPIMFQTLGEILLLSGMTYDWKSWSSEDITEPISGSTYLKNHHKIQLEQIVYCVKGVYKFVSFLLLNYFEQGLDSYYHVLWVFSR